MLGDRQIRNAMLQGFMIITDSLVAMRSCGWVYIHMANHQ
jgi:hypothetical protein